MSHQVRYTLSYEDPFVLPSIIKNVIHPVGVIRKQSVYDVGMRVGLI